MPDRTDLANTQNSTNSKVAKPRPGGRTARVGRQVEEVAAQLLIDRGYDGWSYIEVAEAAGVNRSTLHRRWPNRAAMVLAAMRRIVRARVVFEDTGSLMGDLRAHLIAIGEFLDSDIGKNLVIATLDMRQKGELSFNDGLSWTELSQEILPIFERANLRGDLPEDFDTEGAFAMLSGAMHFRMIVMREKPDAEWVDRILGLFTSQLE